MTRKVPTKGKAERRTRRRMLTLLVLTVGGGVWLLFHDIHMSTELAALGVGNAMLVLLEMLFEG